MEMTSLNLVELTERKDEGWKGKLWREVSQAPPGTVVHISSGALKELLGKAIVEKEWSFASFAAVIGSSGRLPREEDTRHIVRMVRVLLDELAHPTDPVEQEKEIKQGATLPEDPDDEAVWPSVRGRG